jgi:hypothetical protein
MNYLTNYYKNLSEKLQEQVNRLQRQIDEAYIRNPSDQFDAGFHSDKPIGSFGRYASGKPVSSYVTRPAAGWKRMNQMISFEAAKAIAEPHEQEAIEKVLLDMANTQGNQADASHMRTALGALNRVQGTDQFAKSLSAVRTPIEIDALKAASERRYSMQGTNLADYRENQFTETESEIMDDEIFDKSQSAILGKRKNK